MTAEQIAATLSAEDAHILRHSLGVPDPGQTNMYRNHFVTGEGSLDHPDSMALVALGLMTRCVGNEMTGGDDVFFVTNKGRQLVRAELTRRKEAPDAE